VGLPDLALPDWGPYTKKYLGLSHLTDKARGLRFDLSVFPGLYRRRVDVPRVTWESGYHPWEASADLEYFSHRHELEWKDRLYADISFSPLDADTRLVRAALVNATDLPQNLSLQFMASLHFPPLTTYSEENLEPGTVDLPQGVLWRGALEYTELKFARPRPQDHLGYDGQWRAEARDHGFVDGQAVGQGFGQEAGDTVAWAVPEDGAEAVLIRYRVALGETARWTLENSQKSQADWEGTGEFATCLLTLAPGARSVRLTSRGGAAAQIDGLAYGRAADLGRVTFGRTVWNPVAERLPGPTDKSFVLRYADTPLCYGLAWRDEGEVRQFRVAELDRYLRHYVHEHVKKAFHAPGNEHFTNVSLRPLTVAAQSTRLVYALVASGTEDEVQNRLGRWPDAESVWKRAQSRSVAIRGNPAGDAYRFSQDRLAATVLTNVVFPVYTRKQYIRHFTPGKWWDCLYTWDSGFIGLGFLEFDTARAVENLKAYLTDPGDDQAAFLHHGSPVPVQFALFHELWNRTGDANLLTWAYPRLRQYYRYLAGFDGGSTTASLASGLRKTWDYFYNSGGWDDYPPQVEVHARGLEATVAPVISTSQAALCALLLTMAAEALGLSDDVREYEEHRASYGRALQTHSWDEAAGCFSYVVHDKQGLPQGPLRHASGQNFNRGLDGFYPVVAGLTTPDQNERIVADLESPRFWTDVGLLTVDRSAAYYRVDGYWNGAVWMAHQWYFWKALLDLGRGDFAWKIARTALDNARRETDETYCCFEHWVIESGRGAGWHQFGGLSSPILTWFAAYFVPGRLSVGFQTRVAGTTTLANGGLGYDLTSFAPRAGTASVVMVLPAERNFSARWNGSEVEMRSLISGAWALDLPQVPGQTRRLEFLPRES
jgi:hypothetical protein